MRAAEAKLVPPLRVSNYDLEAQRSMVVEALMRAAERHNLHEFYQRWHNRYPRAQLVFSGKAKIRDETKLHEYDIPTHVPPVNHIHFRTFLEAGVSDFFRALKKKGKYVVWYEAGTMSIRFYDHVRVPVPKVP